MRGLFVCSTFPRPDQPAWGLVNGLHVRALSKRIEMQVLCPLPWFPLLPTAARPCRTGWRDYFGIPLREIRAFYVPLSRGAINGHLYALSIRRPLSEMCERFRPDFLLTSFGFPDAVGVAREAARLRLPLVAILRGSDVHAYRCLPSRWRAIIRALQCAAMVVPISRSLADAVIEGGVDERRVVVIPYGIDQDTFRLSDRAEAAAALGLPLDRKRILFVGNLIPIKSVPTLIEAFRHLVAMGDSHSDLYLIGEGPERQRLERLIQRSGLAHRARLLGSKTNDEVARWMAASDVFCLPSLNEGLPNVILEAFACGLPVVASRVGGIPEIHSGADCGALVEPGDAPALAAALQDSLGRVWDRHALAARVRDFTWERNSRTFHELLQTRVVASKPPA